MPCHVTEEEKADYRRMGIGCSNEEKLSNIYINLLCGLCKQIEQLDPKTRDSLIPAGSELHEWWEKHKEFDKKS